MCVVDDDQLRVHPQVLLLVTLTPKRFRVRSDAKVSRMYDPFTDAVLTTTENVHFDTAISRRREPFENDRVHIFRMLDIQPLRWPCQ